MIRKLSILFVVVCMASLLDQSVGLNYYLIQKNPRNPGRVTYTLIPAFLKPDCDDNKKEKDDSSSSEESSESSLSSENSSEERKDSREKKDKKENKSKEAGGSSGSDDSKSRSEEDSSEGKEDKKKEDKKKDDSNSLFPPRTYNLPPSKIRKIMYSPLSSYAYSPFRSVYVAQPPVGSYSLTKNGYRYIPVPDTASGTKNSKPSATRRLVNSPVTKIVYSPSALSYPAVSKTGASIYSAQDYWNNPFTYFKK